MSRILRIAGPLAAIGGFAAFAMLYPRANAGSEENLRWNRTMLHREATARVRQALNVDISSWPWLHSPQSRDLLFLWQRRYARTPFDRLLAAHSIDFAYSDPSGRRDITVSFSPDNRVVGIRSNLRQRARRRDANVKAGLAEENAKLAFAALAGDFQSRFPSVPQLRGESEYRWTAATDSDPRLRWQIYVRVDPSGNVRDAAIRTLFDDAVSREFSRTMRGMGETKSIVGGTLAFLTVPILGGMFIFGWLRKTVDRRAAITASILWLLPPLLLFPLERRGFPVSSIAKLVAGTVFIHALLPFVFIGTGQRAARELEWRYWRAFRLLLEWKWRSKAVAGSIAGGLLWSGLLAVIPSLVVLSGVFPGTYLETTAGWSIRFSNVPGSSAFSTTQDLFAAFLFATLLPLVSQRFPSRILSLLLFVPAASLAVYFVVPVNAGPGGAGAVSALLVAAALFVYLREGLLASLAAVKGCNALWIAANLIDGGDGLQANGWVVLAMFAGTGIVAFLVARRAPDIEPADPIAGKFLSHRERLKAEFSLAQQAQQRMLPNSPPTIPGFALAASCQPARDVGGDLYDYFPLPGGKTGLCVADVSGKGMPAALYMTLTKGLIAAAAPESSSVDELARKINRHLHVACRKRVFVTAVIASVDTATRTVDFVRAGHNPALLYESVTGKARYLNPPGLGLGLAGPALFDRGTRSGQVQLAPGDTLILYSDGVTEAMNERLEQYGEERLQQAVERAAALDAALLLGEIRKDLERFTGTEPSHDDATLLVLQAK